MSGERKGAEGGEGKVDPRPSRSWMLTDFNVTDERKDYWRAVAKTVNKAVIGEETCPTTGRKHLQGLLTFKKAIRFSGLRRQFPKDIHWERTRQEDAAERYCMKEWNMVVNVSNSTQGARNDLKNYQKLVLNGERRAVCNRAYPDIATRCPKYYQNLRTGIIDERDPDKPPTVVWIWGPAGIGKTGMIYKVFERKNVFITWRPDLRWFCGYYGQPVAVLDDVDVFVDIWKLMLRLLDRYPMKVEIKGDTVEWNPDIIIVTAVCPPEQAWLDVTSRRGEPREQLYRRIHHVYEVTDDASLEVARASLEALRSV